tara:strand:+ start:2826 stop:3056 length:231 start_codon:yes stop_codon:yes gene_type:complete
MNIKLTLRDGSKDKVLVNWDNVVMAKTLQGGDGGSVFDSSKETGEIYTELTLTSKRLIYVTESLAEIEGKAMNEIR